VQLHNTICQIVENVYKAKLRLIKAVVLYWFLGCQVVSVRAKVVDYHWFNSIYKVGEIAAYHCW